MWRFFHHHFLWDIILILITATLLMDIKVTTLHQCPCTSSLLNSNSIPKASSCSMYIQSNVASTMFTFLCWTSVFLAKSLSVIQQEVTTTTHFAVCTNWHTATSHQQTLEEVTILVTDRGTCLLLHSDLWTEGLTVKFVLRWLQSVICAAEIRTVFLREWCYLNCWNWHRTHQNFSEQELTAYV